MTFAATVAISALFCLATGIFAFRAIHRRAKTGFFIALGVLLAVSGYLFLAAASTQGWDGLGYAIALVVGSLPATAALLVGGGVGLLTRSKLT